MGKGGVIEWEEPPDRTGVHEALFDELRAAPGEWAVFKRKLKQPGSTMYRLSQGMYRGIKAGELEVTSHRAAGGTTIYVRIKGEQ